MPMAKIPLLLYCDLIVMWVAVHTRHREEHSDVAIHVFVQTHKAKYLNYTTKMDCHTVCGRFAMMRDSIYRYRVYCK